jgi:hypothetical protein
MADTGTPVPASSTGVEPSTGTPEASVTFATREDFDGYKKFANKELQGLRKGLDNLVTVEKLEEILNSRLPAPAATGADKHEKSIVDAEARREVETLKAKYEEAERKLTDEKINGAIREATKGVLPGMEDILHDAIKVRAKLDRDGFVVVETEDGLQRVTAEYVRGLKGSDNWYPATGKPGTGLTGGGFAGGSSGIDLERGLADQEYWDKNQPALIQELARRQRV